MLRVVTCRYLLYIEDDDKNLLVTCMLRVVTLHVVTKEFKVLPSKPISKNISNNRALSFAQNSVSGVET